MRSAIELIGTVAKWLEADHNPAIDRCDGANVSDVPAAGELERLIGSNFRPVVPVVTKKIGAAHRGWKTLPGVPQADKLCKADQRLDDLSNFLYSSNGDATNTICF